jgi:hypothetical protein
MVPLAQTFDSVPNRGGRMKAILAGRGFDLGGPSSERLCASFKVPDIREAQALADLKMSVRQSSGET